MKIRNAAGEVMDTVDSDAQAARWFLEQGRRGDYLEETGEDLADVVDQVFPNARYGYAQGAVVHGTTGEGEQS
jgi:hypothetical protein